MLSETDGDQPGITGQTGNRQKPELTGRFRIRASAMNCGYYRTSSPVTALPMITGWISDVPSKIVKLMEVRAVSAARWAYDHTHVSTNSARCIGHRRLVPVRALVEKTGTWRSAGSVRRQQTEPESESRLLAGTPGSSARVDTPEPSPGPGHAHQPLASSTGWRSLLFARYLRRASRGVASAAGDRLPSLDVRDLHWSPCSVVCGYR